LEVRNIFSFSYLAVITLTFVFVCEFLTLIDASIQKIVQPIEIRIGESEGTRANPSSP